MCARGGKVVRKPPLLQARCNARWQRQRVGRGRVGKSLQVNADDDADGEPRAGRMDASAERTVSFLFLLVDGQQPLTSRSERERERERERHARVISLGHELSGFCLQDPRSCWGAPVSAVNSAISSSFLPSPALPCPAGPKKPSRAWLIPIPALRLTPPRSPLDSLVWRGN